MGRAANVEGVKAWHAFMHNPSPEALNAMLADDAVFHSPVVHTPQKGRKKVFMYLWAASHVLAGHGTAGTDFKYLRELVDEQGAMLEFQAMVDGITVNGVDIVTWNDEAKITDFKVMVRPLRAVNKLHALMGAQLAKV
ncbi:hypothetical protein DFJ74DRAFT_657469 [Hyaloraphidium curvatum]|nr:hypothetical protein DFJ74DRAFT_657469 [Hyaloraphidium curvatum]